jgi:hypothetical protein
MHVAVLLAVVTVLICLGALSFREMGKEHYSQDTGADWLRAAWETLVPGECVDFGVIVDKLGARQGQFFYFDDPKDLTVYREILADGSDGFMRVDAPWASSRAEVALNPASKYHKALTTMDEMSEKYRNQLSGMNIWFLPGGAPARFDRLSVGVISSRVAPNGVHVWKVHNNVASRPRESAHGVISLFSYAKLLTDLDRATLDFEAMQNAMKREDVLTATTLIAVDDSVKRATGVIKAEQQAAQQQLWRAAKINSDAADVVRRRALKLAKVAGDDTDKAKKEHKLAAAADAHRKSVDSANDGLERTGKMYRMEATNVNAGAASIEGTANQMKVTNWAEYEEALAKIDDLSRERTRLDSQTAELSGKLANMQERVAYLSHPSRMDADKASLARALDDLKKATAALDKNLTEAESVSTNQTYLQNAVSNLKTNMANAQANSTQATISSEQAFRQVGDLRGRLEAAKTFSQERARLEASFAGEKTKEQSARDAMSAANAAAAATDGNPRLIMCTAEYAAQRQRAQEEAERQRKAAAESAAASERDRLAREQADRDRVAREQADRDRLAREQAERNAFNLPSGWTAVPNRDLKFSTLRQIDFDSSLSFAQAKTKCIESCSNDRSCYVALIHNPQYGRHVCKLGNGDASRTYKVENVSDPDRWYAAIKPGAPQPVAAQSTTLVVANKELKYSGTAVSGNSGSVLKVTISRQPDLYKAKDGFVSFNLGGLALAHAGGVVSLRNYAPNNLDFAWKLFLVSNFEFVIYNEYQNLYLSYDGNTDKVVISPRMDKWSMSHFPPADFYSKASPPKPPPPAPAPAAPKCNPDACNRTLDSWNAKNWAYVSSSFPECALCPVVREPKRIPGGTFDAPSARPPPPRPPPPPPPPPPPRWFQEDGQRFQFQSYKEIKLDRNDDEHKSAARCLAACQADPSCWVMSHYKPQKKLSTPQQGICNLGSQSASRTFVRKGDGRSFSAYKK